MPDLSDNRTSGIGDRHLSDFGVYQELRHYFRVANNPGIAQEKCVCRYQSTPDLHFRMSVILPQSRAGIGELRGRVASMFRVLRLLGLAPSQAPQSAHCEDKGEQTNHAQRVKRPNEQESWAGLGDRAAKNASRSHHVDDRYAQRKE